MVISSIGCYVKGYEIMEHLAPNTINENLYIISGHQSSYVRSSTRSSSASSSHGHVRARENMSIVSERPICILGA
jgi:hypothetical protein